METSRPNEEKIGFLQNGLHSIYNILFGDEENNYKVVNHFLDSLKEMPEKAGKTGQNLITIDLNESVKTRNQKKSPMSLSLKENKKIENLPIQILEDNEEKEQNNKRHFKEEDEEYEPIQDDSKFTNRKRKARNELKKTTTGKKLKRDMLREMKQFTAMTQNSIEYDLFF